MTASGWWVWLKRNSSSSAIIRMHFRTVPMTHKQISKSLILCFTPHPTLWMLEMPMYKGFETSVGCSPPSTHPPLTLHSDVIIKGKSSQREMWNNYCLTSNESYRTGKAKLVLFSVGSKLWFRRLRTPSPCPSDWWFVLIASFASINVW